MSQTMTRPKFMELPETPSEEEWNDRLRYLQGICDKWNSIIPIGSLVVLTDREGYPHLVHTISKARIVEGEATVSVHGPLTVSLKHVRPMMEVAWPQASTDRY